MISEIDKDGSGQIDFDEFFTMMTTRPSDNELREEVHKVFITFDSQKTGFIALKDLRKVAKDLGELTDDTILQDMIDRADTDGDGVVSEEEFYNLITKKAHWNIIYFDASTINWNRRKIRKIHINCIVEWLGKLLEVY